MLDVLIVGNAEPFTSAWTCSSKIKLECGEFGGFTLQLRLSMALSTIGCGLLSQLACPLKRSQQGCHMI